jgi:hypothetical protein
MDLQFATLLSILRTPLSCNHKVSSLNDALALPPRHSSDSDSSIDCQHSLSQRDWHEEESSVSSSFTNASSNDETSAAACATSLSSNSSPQKSDERTTTMVFFEPPEAEPIKILTNHALRTVSEGDSSMFTPEPHSHMVPDYFSPLPPTHSSAALSTDLTVGEGGSGPTDIHGTQPDP